ncbi:hypothetical protein [Streptomyces halobius]|uniref:Uncharacterized protein n=1 Tax=Streptomyces halobius TaxID=2879846 RepID=A0ABY4M1J3_9ACTN|nr:hypothetical protein [Streptomyces halobius]UQA91624.1 hypothetical protein K9S39_06915 [Streptomyces halobius]
MKDREWWCVAAKDGARTYPDELGNYEFPNIETAEAVVAKFAPTVDGLVLMRGTVKIVKVFERSITITETVVS